MKGLIVTLAVVSVSIGTAVVVDDTKIFIPQHEFKFELNDTDNDIFNSNIDIIAYGSYKVDNNLISVTCHLYVMSSGKLIRFNKNKQMLSYVNDALKSITVDLKTAILQNSSKKIVRNRI